MPPTASGHSPMFDLLLHYSLAESRRWHEWFHRHPDALAAPLDVAGETTVAGLVRHIVAVELRYAERLHGMPVTSYDDIPVGTIDELMAVGDRARELLARFHRTAAERELDEVIVFETRTLGPVSASRRRILVHAIVHGIRHWAQIATALRQAGFPEQWPHDLLFAEGAP